MNLKKSWIRVMKIIWYWTCEMIMNINSVISKELFQRVRWISEKCHNFWNDIKRYQMVKKLSGIVLVVYDVKKQPYLPTNHDLKKCILSLVGSCNMWILSMMETGSEISTHLMIESVHLSEMKKHMWLLGNVFIRIRSQITVITVDIHLVMHVS